MTWTTGRQGSRVLFGGVAGFALLVGTVASGCTARQEATAGEARGAVPDHREGEATGAHPAASAEAPSARDEIRYARPMAAARRSSRAPNQKQGLVPPTAFNGPGGMAAGGHAVAPAPYPAQPALDDEGPIDPNGRFATTYRPGGGHLSAFDAAVATGIVPAAEREVVADIGARYVPDLPAPESALALKIDPERKQLNPSGGPLHLRLALRSTDKNPTARPRLSVHLVLDVSGSMSGESISRARQAAQSLVGKLGPSDDFSLVTFSTEAKVRVPEGPVGPRLEQIQNTIYGIEADGGTNLGEGLRLAYEQAKGGTVTEDAIRVVFVLSDGRANEGIVQASELANMALGAFQDGIQTSTFGLGTDYDGALMSQIAADGAGGYYYLRDADRIAPALSTELGQRLDPVATAVEVRLRLKPDVQVLRVYGSRRLTETESARVRSIELASDRQTEARDRIKQNRQHDAEGGMRFFIPAFARDDAHAILIKLNVPAGVGDRGLGLVELKYKDRVAKKNVTAEIAVSTRYANSDNESARSVDLSVARTTQGFLAGDTLMQAAARIAAGDRARASALLTEREQILRQAAITLDEPAFLRDGERMARLAGHAGTTSGLGEPLVLAMLLETAGRSRLR